VCVCVHPHSVTTLPAAAHSHQLHARTHGDGDWTSLQPAPLTGGPASEAAASEAASIPNHASRAAVFVGPMEHHSNLLVWREWADVVVVPALPCGRTDPKALVALLIQHKNRCVRCL
jgi:hypothetical protein